MKIFVAVMMVAILSTGCVAPTTKQVQVGDVQAELEAKKQRELALRTIVEDQMRLYKVAYQVRTKAVDFCPDTSYVAGVAFADNVAFGAMFKEAINAVYGISDVIKVFYVQPGSPAELAGVKVGDIPTSINGWVVPVGGKANEAVNSKIAELAKNGKQLTVSVMRDNAKETLTISPIKACAYSAQLSPDDIVNAFADGKQIIITKGMMRFAKDDTELSLVVGHELAHNAMEHIKAKTTNQVFGSIFDLVAAAYGVNTQGAFGNAAGQAYSQEFESEADYVGLYMIAKAGVDINNAPNFWRRMATDHPAGINKNHASSHPSTPQRFLALEATVNEIKVKITNGQALLPDTKKK